MVHTFAQTFRMCQEPRSFWQPAKMMFQRRVWRISIFILMNMRSRGRWLKICALLLAHGWQKTLHVTLNVPSRMTSTCPAGNTLLMLNTLLVKEIKMLHHVSGLGSWKLKSTTGNTGLTKWWAESSLGSLYPQGSGQFQSVQWSNIEVLFLIRSGWLWAFCSRFQISNADLRRPPSRCFESFHWWRLGFVGKFMHGTWKRF